MNDIVYTLVDTSHNDFMELKYSLRSLELYGLNYGMLVIVGGLPSWIDSSKIIHIEAEDKFYKTKNIMTKVLAAAQSNKVTEDFWHFNDDYFFLQSHDFKTLESCKHERNLYNYVWGKNREKLRFNHYTRIVERTYSELNKRNLPIEFYDVHLPFKYNSNVYQDMTTKFSWECKQKLGFIIRSIYGNYINMDAKTITRDVKIKDMCTVPGTIKHLKNQNLCMFSSGEKDQHNLVKILQTLYPNKSKWEKDEKGSSSSLPRTPVAFHKLILDKYSKPTGKKYNIY